MARIQRFFPIALATALPLVLSRDLLPRLWQGARPRAWDGMGHYALAQIYDRSTFPDTFGWTHAYFGGMPFPNFYPPLFYWLVALLHHVHIVAFATAFKLVVVVPVFLLPAAVWILAWKTSNKDRGVATCSALAVVPVLIDERFNLIGLNYNSTFITGLYTQPLGFILLAAWYVTYTSTRPSRAWPVAACLLLALTALANFFNAITAVLLVAPVLVDDLARHLRAAPEGRQEERRRLVSHAICPVIALLLTLFWITPMLRDYSYLVTRPHAAPLGDMMPPVMCTWYVLAAIGAVLWVRRRNRASWPYLCACLIMACSIILAASIFPRWLPLQAPRFLAALTLLLAPAVGHTLATGVKLLASALGESQASRSPNRKFPSSGRGVLSLVRVPITTAIVIGLAVVICATLKLPSYDLAFYETVDGERIDDVLHFARQHRDGRYLVEIPWASAQDAAEDGRALDSYLGAQGNEALSVVFREASPNSIFFNAVVNTFSAYPDSFGISSVLMDDFDFVAQPLGRHLDRARFIGVKYLVIFTPSIKERLAREHALKEAYDLNEWTIFELKGDSIPAARPLAFKPSLLVSNFSLKSRRSNEYDFVRLAEEQFIDDAFEVLLARAPESKIDQIEGLDNFGSLILDTYHCENEIRAFEQLRHFAQTRPLILLSSDATLFKRIEASIADFPKAQIIDRPIEPAGKWLEAMVPTAHYGNSSLRKVWSEIRRILEREEIATGAKAADIEAELEPDSISIAQVSPEPPGSVPILTRTTYLPDWQRNDGQPIYAATPFYMLTFVRGSARILFSRRRFDWAAVYISATTLLMLLCATAWVHRAEMRAIVVRVFTKARRRPEEARK